MPEMGDVLVARMTPVSAELAMLVYDEDGPSIADLLAKLDRHELEALCVVLAAQVDIDAPMSLSPADRAGSRPAPKGLFDRIVAHTALVCGVAEEDILSDSRSLRHTMPRAIVCWIAAGEAYSHSEISRRLGRDRSTVANAVKKVANTPRMKAIAGIVISRLYPQTENAS